MAGNFFVAGLADNILQNPAGALKAAFIIAAIGVVFILVSQLLDDDTTDCLGLFISMVIPTIITLAGGLFFIIISMADFVNVWQWRFAWLIAAIPALFSFFIGFLLIICVPLIVILLPSIFMPVIGDEKLRYYLLGTLVSSVLAGIYTYILCSPAFRGNIDFYFNMSLK